MSGHGGYKHRKRALKAKRRRAKRIGAASIARVKAQVEAKGQTFDPAKSATQQQSLNHQGRRLALRKTH